MQVLITNIRFYRIKYQCLLQVSIYFHYFRRQRRMAGTSQNPNFWSFLTAIPAEIRSLIYEAAFNVGDILLIRYYSANKRDERPRDAFPRLGSSDTPFCMVSCTSLLRCCRATYNEGRAALLSCKHVIFLNRRQSVPGESGENVITHNSSGFDLTN